MSMDIVVWDGPPPGSDQEAEATWAAMGHERIEPTPAVRAFLDELLAQWPDVTRPGGEDFPWSNGDPRENVHGGYVHLEIVASRAVEASVFVANAANRLGLVAFGPGGIGLLEPVDPGLAAELVAEERAGNAGESSGGTAPSSLPAPKRRWFRR